MVRHTLQVQMRTLFLLQLEAFCLEVRTLCIPHIPVEDHRAPGRYILDGQQMQIIAITRHSHGFLPLILDTLLIILLPMKRGNVLMVVQ